MSEQRSPGDTVEGSWRRRAEESLAILHSSRDVGVRMLWLADALANARAIARGYSERDAGVWECLELHDPEQHRWYLKSIVEGYMGFSCEVARRFFRQFLASYLETKDAEVIDDVERKASLIAYSRLIRRIREKSVVDEGDLRLIGQCVDRIREVCDSVDSLDFRGSQGSGRPHRRGRASDPDG